MGRIIKNLAIFVMLCMVMGCMSVEDPNVDDTVNCVEELPKDENDDLIETENETSNDVQNILSCLKEYEELIASLKEQVEKQTAEISSLIQKVESLSSAMDACSIKESDSLAIATGVKEAALSVVEKAMSHEGEQVLRFLISSDAHQKNDNDLITKGTQELGQAQSEILKLINVNFVASLGDVAWASSDDSVADVISQIQMYKDLTSEGIEGNDQLWCEGNHDDANYSLQNEPNTPKLTADMMYSYFYGENTDVVYDLDHYKDGYCYKDYVSQKVRVICLNTEQGDGDGATMEGYQLKWFAEIALDMAGKEDWNVITLAHHPLDYGMASLFKDAVNIVDAFINGDNFLYTTTDGTKISIDYSNKNCQYVAHFHGHTHAFSVVRMQKYIGQQNGEANYVDLDAWEICIPNACYARNNQNADHSNPRIARFSTPITYDKEDVDGKRTSFNLVTICIDEKIIYLDCYGAGIDREVQYDFGIGAPTD